ncbi:MAG TPA: PIN domain-containing protein [Actinopolymorphaceae bacterium]
MSLSVALADANVLLPRTLRDYVVYSAKVGAFQVHWSQSILDEVSRNLVKIFGLSADDTAELEIRLGEYLPQALVEVRPRDLKVVDKVDMDSKDRHVVAAALSAKASILVTDNVRDFPKEWLSDRGIELLTAADLLVRLATDHPEELKKAHALTVGASPKTEDAILDTLENQIGKKATDKVRAVLATGPEAQSESASGD